MSQKISIIIPVHNSEKTLQECLQALCDNDYQDREIIIVNDASSDSSMEIAGKFYTNVIHRVGNHGPASARNLGAIQSTGDILFFMDSDVIIPKNALSLIAETFQDRSINAITGLLSDTQRHINFFSEYKNLWMHHTYEQLKDTASVFYTSGAAIRRDVFINSGSFDEHYRKPSVEDTDFGHRLKEKGHDVHVSKDLAVEHIKKYSIFSMLHTDFRRSSALTRLFLRRGLLWKTPKNSSSVPTPFITSLFLLFGSVLLLAAGLSFARYEFLAISAIVYIAFLFSNLLFLKHLWKKKGLLFGIKSIGAITIDTLVAGLGVFTGCVGYAIGERY